MGEFTKTQARYMKLHIEHEILKKNIKQSKSQLLNGFDAIEELIEREIIWARVSGNDSNNVVQVKKFLTQMEQVVRDLNKS